MKKIIAMYLPQYYSFPENDEWWGKGFTDWTNVRKAKPLFRGHMQPKIPLDNNYYCLLDKKTHLWQADLAKKYGIDGFCYYHYWFNGKMLLEKPIELVLNNPDIKIKYCFSWANESWARTWDGQEKKYLIKQSYGGQEDWENHFQYLVKFFKDSRYIRIDDMPVMLLYTSSRIARCEEMVEYWNTRIKSLGFKGLYVIETLNAYQKEPALKNSQGVYYFEPAYTLSYALKKKNLLSKGRRFLLSKMGIGGVLKYDARVAYELIEKRNPKWNKTIYKGTFTDWDPTPRKGKKGLVMCHNSPDLFRKNINKLLNEYSGGDYVFINAWNEWAEGAYLEPDEDHRYDYLEICKNCQAD